MVIKQLSFLKDTSARIMFAIFLANIFYDDPTLYLYKRIVYSICIYYVIWEIGKAYYETRKSLDAYRMPAFYNVYIPLLGLFIMIALSKDLTNPNLKWITLLNNPFCLLSFCPILLFGLGTNTKDIREIFNVLLFAVFTFAIVVALPVFGKVKYYQGYICAYAFIPLFFISNALKRYQFIAWGLLFVGLLFSNLSDYRIIALRIILFMSLFIGLTMFKKVGLIKLLILCIACFGLYQFITNLEDLLALFKGAIGVKTFDDDDTRGFLWTEVLGDLKGTEYIIGKGFLGTYFSEYFLMILVHYGTYSDHYERFSVEVGFLQLLLKGGFLWYLLYITPMLYTSIKGIFWHYNNKLVLSISIFLFTELMLMYIENIPYFSFQSSLLFFLAGFALRKMADDKAIEEIALSSEQDTMPNAEHLKT